MNFNIKSFFLILVVLLATKKLTANTLDSTGIKKEGGKTYVIYKVEPNQTLYSLVKKYGSSVAAVKLANPEISESVKIGQIIKIPYTKPIATSPVVAVKKTVTPSPKVETVNMATHVVDDQQTLFSIATQYKVTMVDLRKWNNLKTDGLSKGQTLIVSEKEYLKNNANTKTDAPKTIEVFDENDLPITRTTDPNKTQQGYKRIVETGVAELIDVEDKSGKLLALHKTAPIGTLINVKNISNGHFTWVKVIGKLPEPSGNTILKLSPKAYQKLSNEDKKIRTEIFYLLP